MNGADLSAPGAARDGGLRRFARPTDRDLVLRVQEHDPEAMGLLYDRLAARAYGLAEAMCGDEERACDVVCESFLAMWRDRESYDPGAGAVDAWALGIVRDRAVASILDPQPPRPHLQAVATAPPRQL